MLTPLNAILQNIVARHKTALCDLEDNLKDKVPTIPQVEQRRIKLYDPPINNVLLCVKCQAHNKFTIKGEKTDIPLWWGIEAIFVLLKKKQVTRHNIVCNDLKFNSSLFNTADTEHYIFILI